MKRPTSTSAHYALIADLYQQHQSWLLGWLYRRLGNRDTAADLSQDSFVRLLGKPELPAERPARSFLALIARGLLIDFFRRSALERSYLEYLVQQPEQCAPDPQDQQILLEQLRAIDRQLDGLSGRARRAFLLHRLEGLSQQQIATQLGVSPTRVQQYLAQALRHCYAARFETEHD
ncbi:putative RNA polymerase sigma factor FecI [compost metagenome]|uniref:RNA polymerase sigma-70 factor, ECF subfamily n=1 Tax=Pseudomonas jinjuensis TaxID=198616 RepID=A0A1H0RB05_9PSED|nr:sigma-70 family RNA polymerase sigma factor [Pseudomonas jinjuensis]SDP26118.1 RNA polymerase sigma-70 factor, ECF subfamily [Pseudomonas jinjuensis]